MMETTQKPKKKSKRIFYLDALRALAILCVITYHVVLTTRFLTYTEITTPTLSWIIAAILTNSTRIGVDIFLMLSGALSLGREWEIRTFLGKRLPRIAEPYLFWITTTIIVILLAQYLAPQIIHAVPSFTAGNIWEFILKALQSKAPYYYSYWFFWMILGTYLIMPIFNKWLLHSDLKEAEYFLIFWLITSLFNFTLYTPFPIKLDYFVSPIGMVVLGYYLRHTKRKIFDNMYLPVILIVGAMALQLYLSFTLSNTHKIYRFDRYSILMVMQVVGIFLLFRNLDEKKGFFEKVPNRIRSIFKKAVASIAKYSYGFYLIHLCILMILTQILKYYGLFVRFKLVLFVLTVSTVVLCWIVMALLNRVKYVNKVIGAK